MIDYLASMNSEIIFVVEEVAEGGYTAKALAESIYSEAETMQELRDHVKEAVLTHFDEGKQPSIITAFLI